jgi:putative ABC transport system substrate-binding protein
MRRREFITLICGAAAAWPLAAHAQQPERMRRLAVLMGGISESDPDGVRRRAAFQESLQRLGWSEGRNIQINYRFSRSDADRINADARELVGLAPDVILSTGTPSTAALQRATGNVPIVFAIVSDPVGDGFVASLAKPGGNITGFSSFESEIGGKWLEMLKEIAPGVTRVALVFNPRTAPGGGSYFLRPFFEAAARSFAVETLAAPAHDVAELEHNPIGLNRKRNGGDSQRLVDRRVSSD